MTPPPNSSKTVEIKVIAATAATLTVSIAFAVLDAIAHNPAVLDGFPVWSRFVIVAAIPPVLTFLAGYATPSNRT